MKRTKIFIKSFCIVLTVLCAGLFTAAFILNDKLPSDYRMYEGKAVSLDASLPVTVVYNNNYSEVNKSSVPKISGENYNVKLKLFGFFPIKSATVNVIDEMYVSVLGQPFGIKIYSEGVMVVGTTDVDTATGLVNPGVSAGIQKGDIIISINGISVKSNGDVAKIIEDSAGQKQIFLIRRNDKEQKIPVIPQLSVVENKYKVGIWVRDSSAGIGTLTFYSPNNSVVCGLGHGICDSDTGEVIPLNSGQLVNAEILSVVKGKAGSPGELRGRFTNGTIADLMINDITGVYGVAKTEFPATNLVPIALKQEVKSGPAQILTTIDGGKPQYFVCEIDKVHYNDDGLIQNMVIKITDPVLLEKTGGIVQGMSGSPILQEGKLVGAVTHVFVNDSMKGYGIFAENMFNSSKFDIDEKQKKVS
ncbi:MAG: SpoIVB peptidase [Oscillospiraceae bacterium]